ncbi:F-box domain-containing protein [Pleurotus pulmonarius]
MTYPELPPEIWRKILRWYMADQENNIMFIRDVNRLFYDVAMDHRFERLDLRDLSAGGAFELQHVRDPWLTKRLKWICLSTSTLAQILTEECYRSEHLLPSALQNHRDETTHIIAPSSTVDSMLEAPLIECLLDVLAGARNLRKIVVEVRSPPRADFRCIAFPRAFLHAALARLACGAFAGATTTLALRVDYELLAVLLDELALVQMPSLTDLAVVAEPRVKERVEPIGPVKGQAFFENLGRVPLESLRVFTKEKAVIASDISSILDHDVILPSVRRLDIATTFDNPKMIKSLRANYPSLRVLILHIIAPDSGAGLPLSVLDLPNLLDLRLSVKAAFDAPAFSAFWHGHLNAPRLTYLTVSGALAERMGPSRLRAAAPQVCACFAGGAVRQLEIHVGMLERALLDALAAAFPGLRRLHIRATRILDMARFEEEMGRCCYPGWDIRELKVEVTAPPFDLGNVDARVLAVIKSALPRASGSS